MDIDDYSSVSEVQIVFDRLFGSEPQVENEIERTLRKLLNNRINNAWGKKDETCLIKLKGENLSASQKLILNQIQEW